MNLQKQEIADIDFSGYNNLTRAVLSKSDFLEQFYQVQTHFRLSQAKSL
jgi:hypothetical protein